MPSSMPFAKAVANFLPQEAKQCYSELTDKLTDLKVAVNKKLKPNSEPTPSQPIPPALRSIARAMHVFKRVNLTEAVEALKDFAIIHFDTDMYERAFVEITCIPEYNSVVEYLEYGMEYVVKASTQLDMRVGGEGRRGSKTDRGFEEVVENVQAAVRDRKEEEDPERKRMLKEKTLEDLEYLQAEIEDDGGIVEEEMSDSLIEENEAKMELHWGKRSDLVASQTTKGV
jgi:hypothetical protein